MSPQARLKSGAYLVIEKTEAMVVVDVNSGRFIGKQLHEQNSLKINSKLLNNAWSLFSDIIYVKMLL